MNCERCSAEAWKCGTGSLHAGECIVCAVNRADEAEAKLKELEAWKSDVMHVINESSGVAGYHKNGDIATWGELGLEGES